MSDHFGHYLLLLPLFIFLCFYYFKKLAFLSLFIFVLTFGLVFHEMYLHFDHEMYTHLTDHQQQCCVLPNAISIADVSIESPKLSFLVYKQTVEYKQVASVIYLYYSRPPPLFS